jgi:DNA-directed RNA polymerase specialized sigma24 family protein
MELTNEIIDMTYKFAWTFLKRGGRKNIDHRDLAHDAMVKLANAAPVPDIYLSHRVWMDVKSVFFEFYTNTTTRKHNILLDTKNLVHADFDMETRDPDTVDAMDEFIHALKIVYRSQPTQCEILMLMLQGKTVQEIAKMRGTSTKAVDQLKQKARKEIAAALGIAA